MRRFMSLLIVIVILWPTLTRSVSAEPSIQAFVRRWTLDDANVANGAVHRSWT